MEGQSLSHFQFLNDKNLVWRGRRLIKNVGLSFGNNDRKISKYKNRFQGKKVFILGNGPSLDLHDLNSLKDEIIFCTNWFPKSPVYREFKFPFFFASDAQFWNYSDEFAEGFIEQLCFNKSVECFFDISGKKAVRKIRNRELGSFINKKTSYLYLNKSRPLWNANEVFSTDPLFPLKWGYSVIVDFCLPIAFFMGFKQVILLGCDCDYKLHSQSNFSKSYFYDFETLPSRNQSYLNYQRDHRGLENRLELWEQGYRKALLHFSKENRAIINSSRHTLLKSIPREPLENFL